MRRARCCLALLAFLVPRRGASPRAKKTMQPLPRQSSTQPPTLHNHLNAPFVPLDMPAPLEKLDSGSGGPSRKKRRLPWDVDVPASCSYPRPLPSKCLSLTSEQRSANDVSKPLTHRTAASLQIRNRSSRIGCPSPRGRGNGSGRPNNPTNNPTNSPTNGQTNGRTSCLALTLFPRRSILLRRPLEGRPSPPQACATPIIDGL